MIQSRITRKARTTIPAPVRKALGLRVGDLVACQIEEGRDGPSATFTEWGSPEDTEGYAGL